MVGAPEAGARMRPSFQGFYRESFADVSRALGITLGDMDLGTEAAAEAMARAYANWPKVSGYDNPAGWVYRVGLNWARSLRRKLRRRNPAPAPTMVTPGPIADPEIHEAVAALAIDLRAVVVCRVLFDWSTTRTATVLGIPEGTVKSRLHRAVGQLERRLRQYNEED